VTDEPWVWQTVAMAFLAWLWTYLVLAGVGVRPRRDFVELERRRQRAGALFAAGKSQADVARELGVSRQSVSRWHLDFKASGTSGLAAAGRAGRTPMLTDAQLAGLERELEKGPQAHGYPTDMWTLARVAEVIEKTTGIAYHPGHVWKILRNKLGWSRQRPARRAAERDDEAIARWVAKDWPRVKKTPDGVRR